MTIVGDLNIPLPQWIHYPHEINKRKKEMGLNHIVAQMDLTDLYDIPSHSSRTDSSQGQMEHLPGWIIRYLMKHL